MAPIHAAVWTNDLAAVMRCIEQEGVSPTEPNQDTYLPQQPLHIAARCGHLEIMAYLLDTCGVDIEAKYWHGTNFFQNALYLAVMNNNAASVRFLLQHNADPNVLGSGGFSPLLAAVYKGYYDAAKALMEDTRCDLDMMHSSFSGISSLVYALLTKKWDFAELLLKKGASLTAKMPSGVTVLDHCYTGRFPQHIKDIIRARHDSLHAHRLHRARCIYDAADDINAAAIAKSEGKAQAAPTHARTRGQKRRMVLAQTPPYLKERVERGGGGGDISQSLAVLPRVEVSFTHLVPGDETVQVQRAVLLHVLGRDHNGGKGGGLLGEHFVELMDMMLPAWDPERTRE